MSNLDDKLPGGKPSYDAAERYYSRKIKRGRLARLLLGIITALALAATGVLIWLELNLTPIVKAVAEARVRAIAAEALNQAIAETTQSLSYDDIVEVTRDAEGNVSLISADAMLMNRLGTTAALAAQEKISLISLQELSVPLGSALGIQMLSGKGPSVRTTVIPNGSVQSNFLSEFTSTGINQTRHRLYLRLTATMSVVMPRTSSVVSVTTDIPIAETILVGDVPNTYLLGERTLHMLDLVP